MLTSHAAVPRLDWIVFVQLPLAEAMAPVRAAVTQTLMLLGLGLLLALIIGGLLARRLVVPIGRLQQGAERFGAGDLSQRIHIRTGDEIETLADRFNQMAGRIQESYETLEAKVDERTRDLNEALVHQTATGEILRVIASSPTDVGPVLDAVAENAAELCQASDVAVLLRKGEDLHFSAHRGTIPIGLDKWPLNRHWTAGRAVLEARVVHVEDLAGPEGEDYPEGRELSQRMGHRAILSVPMLREGSSIGAIVVRRTEPRAFSDKQIALLRTFADQAVIAIDNVRLFEEAQERTRELAASLAELRTAQDRLIQSEKMASLGQLTAGIAHEIKNPLNFVNNFAGLSGDLLAELKEILAGLVGTADADTAADIEELITTLEGNLEKIASHGRRADGIVKSMLMHSRGVSDDVRQVEVNALVE
ncbi:MAG: HAMP domain-containing protein, partial [Ferrovibrionaceae bacterium]